MKRWIALIMCMLLMTEMFSVQSEGLSAEENYRYGHEALMKQDEENLCQAVEYFSAAGAYEDSRMYKMYAETLMYIMQVDISDNLDIAMTNIEVLSEKTVFIEAIVDKYPSLDDLLIYICAKA